VYQKTSLLKTMWALELSLGVWVDLDSFPGLALLGLGLNPQFFMSTDTHFRVKIGFKFQSWGKISNISAADPQFF